MKFYSISYGIRGILRQDIKKLEGQNKLNMNENGEDTYCGFSRHACEWLLEYGEELSREDRRILNRGLDILEAKEFYDERDKLAKDKGLYGFHDLRRMY